MRILSVDTSSRCGVVALSDSCGVLAELTLVSREVHSSRLMPCVEFVLARTETAPQRVDGLGVCLGPGSFTGLRVGLATVKGLAWAHGKPVAGFTSLEALAAGLPIFDGTIVPLLDARRGRVFAAGYRREGERLSCVLPPLEGAVEEVVARLEGPLLFVGEVARRYADLIGNSAKGRAAFAHSMFDTPRGAAIADLSRLRLEEGDTLDILTASPLYLRVSSPEAAAQRKCDEVDPKHP